MAVWAVDVKGNVLFRHGVTRQFPQVQLASVVANFAACVVVFCCNAICSDNIRCIAFLHLQCVGCSGIL